MPPKSKKHARKPSPPVSTGRPAPRAELGDSLHAYIRAISRFEPLSNEEEKRLGERIRAGDSEALNRLVEANLRFVVAYAKRYRSLGLSFIDLIHEGNLGLIEAAKRFDPTRNVRFISYAVWWVRQAILLALSEQSRAFRLPQKMAGQFAKLRNARESLTAELERSPTTEELARKTELSEEEVEALARVAGAGISLSTSIGEEGDLELEDTLEQETIPAVEIEMIKASLVEQMQGLVRDLDEKERQVIRLRYGLDGDEPRTLQEIGEMLGVSRERVRQIESRAKDRLRRTQQAQALRGSLN